MAIEVTRLSASQGADLNTIKAWFDANATDFFDSSEIESNTLSLKDNGNTVMSLSYNTTYSFSVYVSSSLTITKTGSNGLYINRLAKTPHGIAVGFSNGSQTSPYHIFISRTSADRIGIIVTSSLNTTLTSYYIESIDGSLRSSVTGVSATAVYADDITTLTQCVCEGADGEYMPDCFLTVFSQYKNLDCTFVADGIEYLYNGFIAMR